DVATYMENANGSYHSYTFPVIRDNPSVALENILFSLQADGTYKVSLVSYNLSESEKEALFNGQFVDLTNKASIETIDSQALIDETLASMDQGNCTTLIITYCSHGNHPEGYDNGSPCPGYEIMFASVCSGGSNTDPDNPDNSDVPDGENNSGGGVSNSTNNSNNDATSPTIFISYEEQIINCLGTYILNGNSSIQTWLSNANQRDKKALATYLGKGDNCSNPATLDFVVEAIEAMNNGGKFDHINNVILDSTFVANEKLNCVYNKLKADNSSLFRETVGAFIDNPSANLIFTVGNCTTTNDACTDDNYFAETGIIKITIEDVNTNPIEIAALIL